MTADATSAAAPVGWPDGKVAAAALTFDVDAESAVLSADPSSRTRMTVMSHQSYGPLTGVPRILSLLERHAIRATFFVPGYTAERYPSVVQGIADAGHEIAHHSYLHESTIGMDRDTEARMIDRGLEALDSVVGVRPLGYRAPMWELNYHTPSLLLDRGFEYDSSMMDCDLPYRLAESGQPDARDIVEIPVHWALDDWEQYAFVPGVTGSGLIESPDKVLAMWSRELDSFYLERCCFVLTNHPFLTGRPSRVQALERLVEKMESLEGLWVATLGEIAAHTRSLAPLPRHFPEPILPPASGPGERPVAGDGEGASR
ncbi:MAG: polysaccharide deacetylase [Actinomycetota bacterium]|nr:polysaccharide deacetylase [Actinomycetota bacterium]